ncbi:MAG: hypothetical protein HY815_14795 [Candidatus Riflebacteria bacterium]|nr:hypothetical protein [Candidatus Riflebacteria bacterium]
MLENRVLANPMRSNWRRAFLMLLAVLMLPLPAAVVATFPGIVSGFAKRAYARWPAPPAGVNGTPYPLRRPAGHVVLVLLEGVEGGELRAFPFVRRVWPFSRVIDLEPFFFHPLDRLLADGALIRDLSEAETFPTRLRRAGLGAYLHGHRLLQELVGNRGAPELRPTLAEFGEPDAVSSIVALTRLGEELAPGMPAGLHLVQVALPASRTWERGGPMDRLDEALAALGSRLADSGALVVVGAGGQQRVWPFVRALYYGRGIAPGVDPGPRDLSDLAPTLALLIGSPRPAFALGVPHTEMLKGLTDQDATPILQVALRDKLNVADHLSRELYGRRILLDRALLDRALGFHSAGIAARARSELESLLARVDRALADHRRASRPAPPLPHQVLVALAIVSALSVLGALVAARSWSGLLAAALLVSVTFASQPAARLLVLSVDPFGLDRAALWGFGVRVAERLAVAVAATALVLLLAFRWPRISLLALHDLLMGCSGLYLVWFLAYNGVDPGRFNPGLLELRAFFFAGALAVAAPPVFAAVGVAQAVGWRLLPSVRRGRTTAQHATRGAR